MIYKVLKIEEDVDFGCEERSENAPVMAVMTLAGEAGEQRVLRYPDKELYRLDINEGDRIILDTGSGEIRRFE